MEIKKREMYTAPVSEETLTIEENVLCVSTGTNDWVVDPGQLTLFSAMGHPFQQFAEMMSRSSATSGCSLVWRSTDLRLLSYGLT